jgi:AmiR/NasT family two-component response regulator
VLIVRNSMSEEQAHRFLQKRSMDSGNPLVAVARQILDT